MKTKRILVALLLAGVSFGMGSCTKEDIDDIRQELQEQDSRLTSLEEWQKSVNTNISSLQTLIEALEDKDYVIGVTPLADESGYEITFLKSGKITIRHGEAGDTPAISVKQDDGDGKYYWTVNGEWLLDGGNKMPVTGEKGEPGTSAIAPQVRINETSNLWETSVDGGTTWTSTGVKATGDKGEKGDTGAQGDAIFQKDGIDCTSDPNNVTFTLANGSKITLPRTAGTLTIEEATDGDNKFTITITGDLLKKSTGNIVHIRVESPNADGSYIETRSIADGTRWKITNITEGDVMTILAYPAKGVEVGETALLMVTVSDSKGNTLAKGQKVFTNKIEGGTAAAPANIEELQTALTDKDVALVTLVEDLTLNTQISISTSETKTIDLNNQTLGGPKNGGTMLYVKEGTVTFSNGKLDIANPGLVNGNLSNAVIAVGDDNSQTKTKDKSDQVVSKGEIIFDHVELNADVLVRYGSTVRISNSVMTNDLYCVCTNANASTSTTEPITIEITNTKLTGETPIMLNVPSNVKIDGCTITGGWQGVMMRGGTATISNSTISLKRELATPVEGDSWQANQYVGKQWGSGNNMPVAGITMGNNSPTAYQYPTSVTLKNTKVSGYDDYWAVFADATSVCTVDFKYDDQCVFSPALDVEKSFKAGTGKNNQWISVTDGTGTTTKY